MQTLEAEYEIVTPMFIGGADIQDPPELRPPSIKGALRFWWRALYWGHFLHQKKGDPNLALRAMHQAEADLFGAAATVDKGYGQGLCLLKIKDARPNGIEINWPKLNEKGSGYIGYGLDSTKENPHRQAIRNGSFTICLTLKSAIDTQQIQQLKNTLMILGLLGGLGSRSRRGFGSVKIKTLNNQSTSYKTHQEYYSAIRTVINDIELSPPIPLFTAFSQSMRIAHAGNRSNYRDLMDSLGDSYKGTRKSAGQGRAKVPFGLPLNGVNIAPSDKKNRRGSPLFMHIHSLTSEYVALMTFFPAQFHPGREYSEGKEAAFYRPIELFINQFEKVI
ncbi:MAG: type III-B CRISPR module RAMP protein Cmr1 [Gammaproteobacteria bacterium]